MNVAIQNDFLKATFSTLGAELISLKSNSREYIWQANPAIWGKHSPVLFPIIGTLKDDTYFHNGQPYHLPRHGFAREKTFEITEHVADKIVFTLKDDTETLKVYPFQFELKIVYVLVQNSLEVRFEVHNTSNCDLYFSLGGHPGFALPNSFENYSLVFEPETNLYFSLLEQNLLCQNTQVLETENNKCPLHYSLFEKDALVFRNHKIQSIAIQENGANYLKVHFEQFPDLGIWTKTNAPFICIEPWFGHADEVSSTQILKDKAGMQTLAQAEVFQSKYSIEIF
ncbi:aldose 1-epimerase family protein [Flavobacterium sp.]|jgi:galactose mutarotase-like enzyme|uniref:aldose 1-epimerase family protein n=1 Tax=Flavobacterium sp. TaxID=239 RepID=UPI0037BF99F4